MEYTVIHKANEEGLKLQYNAAKHVTTLATGSLFITLVLFERVRLNSLALILLVLALVFFIGSIFCSFYSMLLSSATIRDIDYENRRNSSFRQATGSLLVGLVGFFLGLILISISFALKPTSAL